MVAVAEHGADHALVIDRDGGPAKHPRIELRRGCGIVGVQFGPDKLAGVVLGCGGIVERRECRGASGGWESGSQQRCEGEDRRQSVDNSCVHCVSQYSEGKARTR